MARIARRKGVAQGFGIRYDENLVCARVHCQGRCELMLMLRYDAKATVLWRPARVHGCARADSRFALLARNADTVNHRRPYSPPRAQFYI
jgi:hypothetical protein